MTHYCGLRHGRKRTVQLACSIGTAIAVVLFASPLAGAAGTAQSAAARVQASATQAARDAARAGERLHDAKAAAEAAADQATAAHTQSATAKAARLAAAAAAAQVVFNHKAALATRAQRAPASSTRANPNVDPPFNAGTIAETTRETTKQAENEAKEACQTAKHDEHELEAAQRRLAHEQGKAKPNPERVAEFQAAVDAATAVAAASAAVCTTATATADAERASFDGLDLGTWHEGTPTVAPESDPFPDNYVHSDNVELVGHVRGIVGGSPSCPAFNPTKCPAFSSLNFVTGYKHLRYDIMVANGTGGLSVWSLKDPAHPEFISSIPFDQLVTPTSGTTGTQFWEGEDMTVDSARKLVFMSRDTNAKGLFIIDLKDPWNPVLLGFQKTPQGHTATCINGCRYVWSVGSVQSGGPGFTGKSSPVSVTDVRDPMHPFTYTTAVAANVRRTGSTSGSTHSIDVDFNGVAWVSGSGGVRGYWTSGQHYNPTTDSQGSATPYAPLPLGGGSITGNTNSFLHNAYHFPNALNGRPAGDVMLVTNEANSTNCATAGVFIIASLAGTYDDHGLVVTPPATVPQMTRLATYSPNGKPGQFHGTVGTTTVGDCSAHWFTVRGNLVAQAFYEQGVRFVDVSDPANPVQTGWARVPVRAATADAPAIVSSDMSAAYWHGDYVYASDYQRGVDIYRYKDPIPGVIEAKTCWDSCEK
jgi:hypothetical protein